LNFSDSALADAQHRRRVANHLPSAQSQAPKGKPAVPAEVSIGDLIYIKSDGDKHLARDKYIVTAMEQDRLYARKLVGSQFRAKLYELKYTEVYPASVKCQPPFRIMPDPTSIRTDPYASDSSMDSDASEEVQSLHRLPRRSATSPVPPLHHDTFPEDIPQQLVPQGAIQIVPPPTGMPPSRAADNEGTAVVPLEETSSLRKSSRSRNKPAYLVDYDVK
jgi:hypothetical protein